MTPGVLLAFAGACALLFLKPCPAMPVIAIAMQTWFDCIRLGVAVHLWPVVGMLA